MKLPKTVEFGHLKYDIEPIAELKTDDGTASGGSFRRGDGKIFIVTTLAEQFQRFALMHEMIHTMVDSQGIRLPDDAEENIIDGLSFGFIQMLCQNPWMHDFFSE